MDKGVPIMQSGDALAKSDASAAGSVALRASEHIVPPGTKLAERIRHADEEFRRALPLP